MLPLEDQDGFDTLIYPGFRFPDTGEPGPVSKAAMSCFRQRVPIERYVKAAFVGGKAMRAIGVFRSPEAAHAAATVPSMRCVCKGHRRSTASGCSMPFR